MSRYNRSQGNQEKKGSKLAAKKIVVSYIYLDRAQGQTFEQWDESKGRLVRWENIIQRLNTMTVQRALHDGIIIRYNDIETDIHNMPRKSKWNFPRALENMIFVWCKIVVMQLVRVIGFIEDNIFYVVFLDENHEFYPTEA